MRFRAGSINFEVSFPLVAVMTAVVVFDTTMSVLICFISAVMHEIGHLAAMRYFHSSPKTIKLTLFDIAITDTHKAVRNRKQDIIITLAGVTVNFISAAAGCIIYMLTGSQLCMFFAASHITLGAFNLLPVDSLDGGQALLILLSYFYTPDKALKIINILSLIILFPLALAGFYVLISSGCSFTLLLTSLYLIVMLAVKNRTYDVTRTLSPLESITTIAGKSSTSKR